MRRIIYSGTGLLLIALFFLAFNMLGGQWLTNIRLDLTEDKLYSIGSDTQKIIMGLEKPIELYFFYSNSSSRELSAIRSYALRVEELLKVYEREAKGSIRLHVIDPVPYSDDEDRANGLGLEPMLWGEGAAPVYLGLAGIDSQNTTHVIPFFFPDQENRLEYEISRLVQVLNQPKRPVVGLVTSLPLNGAYDVRTKRMAERWMLAEEIGQAYDLREVAADVKEIPKDVSVLMLVHPKQLSKATLYAIDQFVLRGGKLLAFIDPLSELDPGAEHFGILSKDKSSDLAPLLEAWGVRMQTGKILADGAYTMLGGTAEEVVATPLPFTLKFSRNAFNQNDPSTAGLEVISMSTAGIIESIPGASTHFTPLIHSSDYALPMEVSYFDKSDDHDRLMKMLKLFTQRYIVAARIQGPVASAFADGIEDHEGGVKQAKQINVIVVADTDLLSDSMWLHQPDISVGLKPWSDNAAFVMGALDSLSGSDTLNGLRARGRHDRSFVRVEQMQRKAQMSVLDKQSALQQQLDETERKMQDIHTSAAESSDESEARQQAMIREFMRNKIHIRKQLRELQYELNSDIGALGRQLKVINIAFIPFLLTLCMLMICGIRRIRMRRRPS
ncbi:MULTISPECIES: Gldg family protein [unclassified Pseudomonas]|uniref:GldG family protein n=1 Tax=unclassified Pseudomonas TaxID=196821 RepID=UPI000F581957|nr:MULTISPECIES: Gldg family protein [unclassified Pseudomonas]AZF03583.1 Gliding motility-associated ABC transporter substrate-binding protein GldG [Pseudomonas sp. R5-89-07]AZF46054.1 Gliding motility-associated ABC transporter substrate-binding protein GldG [Pseudomonas sp. R2-7-07]